MAGHRTTRRCASTTTDVFSAVGDGDGQVVDVSGQRWPGVQMRPRDRAITPPPPGQHVSPRTARMINARTGQRLGEETERAAADATRRVATRTALGKTIDAAHPSERRTLAHLFGFTLGRDRA